MKWHSSFKVYTMKHWNFEYPSVSGHAWDTSTCVLFFFNWKKSINEQNLPKNMYYLINCGISIVSCHNFSRIDVLSVSVSVLHRVYINTKYKSILDLWKRYSILSKGIILKLLDKIRPPSHEVCIKKMENYTLLP